MVRWAEMDLPSGELPAGQYDALLSERTRLVAVTAASNILGTRPDVAAITAKARAVGALSYVDGVHATPHGPTDVAALGADFYATSAYKWSGPHIGAVVANPALLETLHPDKLASAPDTVPDRFEWGTPAFADLAGVQRGQRALDVGCGPGALTAVLASRAGADAVSAAEPSASFAAAARERLPGVDVRQSAAEQLPFGGDRFDAVLSQFVVNFLTDPQTGVAEMRRVARPGGRVAACV